jgi:hypothetical protein
MLNPGDSIAGLSDSLKASVDEIRHNEPTNQRATGLGTETRRHKGATSHCGRSCRLCLASQLFLGRCLLLLNLTSVYVSIRPRVFASSYNCLTNDRFRETRFAD